MSRSLDGINIVKLLFILVCMICMFEWGESGVSLTTKNITNIVKNLGGYLSQITLFSLEKIEGSTRGTVISSLSLGQIEGSTKLPCKFQD
ncbi:hypothetical protein P8452_51097 [Trifolium repens]|nr:hypothetical protein P8452_39717 [Trifolium repens]WJX66547.1 hypothetical protein P8452_51097 [Trifolium repens]